MPFSTPDPPPAFATSPQYPPSLPWRCPLPRCRFQRRGMRQARFIKDVSIPDGSVFAPVPPSKTWRMRNSGTCTWSGYTTRSLYWATHETLLPTTIGTVGPVQEVDFSGDLRTAPATADPTAAIGASATTSGRFASRLNGTQADHSLWYKMAVSSFRL